MRKEEMSEMSGANRNSKSKRISIVNFEDRPLRVRIVIAGDVAVGKSCIIKRYCEKRFVQKYLPTIGIDYGATKIYIDKRQVSVHIFDTSGQDIFQEVRTEFYREAHGILLVMDVTRRDTFDYLNDLINEIRAELCMEGRGLDNIVFFLAANKSDVEQSREVDELEVKLWAELYGFPCHCTSATTGAGITDLFQSFFSEIVKSVESGRGITTPRQGKRQMATISRSRERSSSIPLLPQPSQEQVIVITRLRENIDPWIQLGIHKGASREEVNRAYRKLAILLHPDKTQAMGTAEAFKLLGQARNMLLKTIKS